GTVVGGDGHDTRLYDIDLAADIGALSGFEGLTKTGAGVLNLDGPGSSDVTEVEVRGGTLNVAANGGIRTVASAVVGAGATLNVDGTLDFTAGADVLTVAGAVTGAGTIDLLDGDDELVVRDGADLASLANALDGGAGNDMLTADITTSAALGGAAGVETLTKQSEGTLTLSGDAAFDVVNVDGGLLDVTAGTRLGARDATVETGAALEVNGTLGFTGGADTFSVAGTVGGLGTIDMLGGDDTLTLRDGANLAALASAIDGGAGSDTLLVDVSTAAALGGATGFETLIKQGVGKFTIDGPADSVFETVLVRAGELAVSAGALVDPQTTEIEAGATLSVDGLYNGTAGADTFLLQGTLAGTGTIDLLDGDDALTIVNGATVTLSGLFDAGAGTDSLVLAG